MVKSRYRAHSPRSEMNVVPYVDVMLVLLVVLMITLPALQVGIQVDLPRFAADPLDASADEPVILSVDSVGRYYFSFGGDASPLDGTALAERAAPLLNRNPDVRIFVRGDEQATHGSVTRAVGILRSAGAHRITIVTETPPRERP